MNERREKDTVHRNSGPIYMCTHTFTYMYMHRKDNLYVFYIHAHFIYMKDIYRRIL